MNQQEIKASMEIYDKQYNEVRKNQKEVSALYLDVRLKNIEQTRSFWLNLIILSSAIIVGIFPFLVKDSSYLENLGMAIIGIILLVFVDLAGIFYINTILTRESKHLDEQNKFHIDHMNEEIEMLLEAIKKERNYKEWEKEYSLFLRNTVEEEVAMREKQKPKKIVKWFDKYFSTFLVYLMILGVVLIGLSFLNLDSLKFWDNTTFSKAENQCFIYFTF